MGNIAFYHPDNSMVQNFDLTTQIWPALGAVV